MTEVRSSNELAPPVALGDGDLDLETAILLARPELEDLQNIGSSSKGKKRLGAPLNDEEQAFMIQEEYLQGILRFLTDVKFARSLDQALQTDHAQIRQFAIQERAAADDRRAALALSRGQAMPPITPEQRSMETPVFLLSGSSEARSSRASAARSTPLALSSKNGAGMTGRAQVPAASSTKRVSPFASTPGPSIDRNERVECTSCGDLSRMSSCLKAPCEHYYCRDCVKSLVEAFLQDESLFPIRCCQKPMTTETVVAFISISLRQRFEAKNREYSVPAPSRVYCCNGICSSFLGSSADGTGTLACPECGSFTCRECKQLPHPGEPCKDSPGVAQLKQLASEERWQTCPGCKSIVELNTGCYHMTCRCRTQFCYLCAAPWKNCGCPQWEEHRLIAAAERRVENRLGTAAAARAPTHVFDRLVQDMRTTLENNHDCVYHSWSRRADGGRCEECYYHLPNFLMICRRCSLLVCLRCSRNRL